MKPGSLKENYNCNNPHLPSNPLQKTSFWHNTQHRSFCGNYAHVDKFIVYCAPTLISLTSAISTLYTRRFQFNAQSCQNPDN
ncbi:hypothetical protein GDO81_007927 [Engystomops pustulosus]|uniref:Uncharacterized protein n=1 Tax=Engystomops pustulosus TaxID=76066 RepID=A0AAV7CBZ1_ENGPU|nr:hypothetical protein GDO81_007927 [Engystomops pustulosus]